MDESNSGPNVPVRENLARIVMTWTGLLLAGIIIGLFFLWFFIVYDALRIDTTDMFKNGQINEQVQAINSVLETQARLTAQSGT